MDLRHFHKKLADAADPLLPGGSTVLCGVSGGPDSVALLHGLIAVNQMADRRWRLHVAHLDHMLREESPADAAFVRDLARDLRLDYLAGRVDVRAMAVEHAYTTEEAARRARYTFLHDVAVQCRATHVVVAHHADDQAETVLHNIVRGTGLHGLSGMSASRPIQPQSLILLVRPLLGFTRDELLAYLAARNLPYRHDATNEDDTVATRNHLRRNLLPLLRDTVNPRVVQALCRLADQARLADEALKAVARETLRHVRLVESPGRLTLPADALAELPRAARTQIIILLLDRIGAPRKELGAERIDALLRLFHGADRLRRVQLPGGMVVERRGPTVSFLQKDDAMTVADPHRETAVDHPATRDARA